MNLPRSVDITNVEEVKKIRSLCDDKYFEYVDNKFVNLYFFYVLQGNCEEYKKITVELKMNGILARDTLTDEIVKNRTEGGRRYHVNGIYSFRFNETDLVKFSETETEPGSYFHNHTQVEPIQFPPSPELFQHHNSVFIWMGCEQHRKTKRSEMSGKRTTLKVH